MTVRVLVAGGGAFAREALDVIGALEILTPGSFEVIGVLDDDPTPTGTQLLRQRGVPIVGSIRSWVDQDLPVGYDAYLIAIGDPRTRADVSRRAGALGPAVEPLIHPTASYGSWTDISPGTVICAGAMISTNVSIGMHGHVNPNATIGHDVRLGQAVSVNPGAVVSGFVNVEDEVLIGAASVILQGLTIGQGAVVGAAACVTRHVPADVIAKGVPARW